MTTVTRLLIFIPFFAVLSACGDTTDGAARVTAVEIAQAAARQSDRVEVEELAEWLIEGRQDFVLVDVRQPADVEKGQIAEALNVPIAVLMTEEKLKSLPGDRKIVVYSNGSENGAKAATLLRLAGFDAQVLVGGYSAWHKRILNPDITSEELDGESLEVSQQRAYSCYFVGDRGAGSAERPEVKFVPPVIPEDEPLDEEPLPPAGQESC